MTVGASGKAKGSSSASTTPSNVRTASSTVLPTSSPATSAKARPAGATVRSTTLGGPLPGQTSANDEFTKWAKITLVKGLNSNINGGFCRHDNHPSSTLQ
jgi:PERQ amino acid-rich with GYF domain-containing protein